MNCTGTSKGFEVLKHKHLQAPPLRRLPPPNGLKLTPLCYHGSSSKTLQARLVVEDPQTIKEAWDLIATIFNDNKRTRSIALIAELRSLKLGDLIIDAYFRKIESISTIVTSLGSPISNDDVVTIALE
ncbi:hypothetical protein Tco_1066148 [Tanacetum coccineum]